MFLYIYLYNKNKMICNQIINVLNNCIEETGSYTDSIIRKVINCSINQGFADCQQPNCYADDVPIYPVPDDNLVWIQTNFLDFKNNIVETNCSKYLRLDNTKNQYVRFIHANQYFFDDDITIQLIFRVKNLNQKTFLITKKRKTGQGGLIQPHGNSPSFTVWLDQSGFVNIEWFNNYYPIEKLYMKSTVALTTNTPIIMTITKKQMAYNQSGFSLYIFGNLIPLQTIYGNLNANQYRLFENRDNLGLPRTFDPNTGLPSSNANDPAIINDGDWILGTFIQCNDLSSLTATGNQPTSNLDLMGFNLYKRELSSVEINQNSNTLIYECPSVIDIFADTILNATFHHSSGNHVIDYSFYANHAILPYLSSINLPSNTAVTCNCPCSLSINYGFTNSELNVVKDAWQD